MANTAPVRKSTRGRVPNKKYSVDAFKVLDIAESDSDAAASPAPFLDDPEEDEDFGSDAAAAEPEDEEGSVPSSDDATDGSGIATPEEEFEDALSYASETEPLEARKDLQPLQSSLTHTDSKKVRRGIKRKPDPDLHFRGVQAAEYRSSKLFHLSSIMGTDPKDVLEFTRARRKWIQNPTLPSREADRAGAGGMALPFHCSAELYRVEATLKWNWYYDKGGKHEMAKRQKSHLLKLPEAKRFNTCSSRTHHVLMGPYGNQKLLSLRPKETLSLRKVWQSTIPGEDESAQVRRTEQKRYGWLLNAGSRIRCLDWVPNHGGDEQYLAIATTQEWPPNLQPRSAFELSGSFPTCIQLWAFKAALDSDARSKMDMSIEPELTQLICTEWGALKDIRWCPAPRQSRDEGSQETVFIGLLAGIWSDGYARVLDIRLNKAERPPSIYVKYEGAAFEVKPPNTICTCLTWLSATDLAVGCANGFVAIWDLADAIPRTETLTSSNAAQPKPIPSTPSPDEMPRPYFYHCLHQSYVLSLVSTFPSNFHFLVSSSMDGYLRLTDVRNPMVDFVFSQRTRSMSPALDYHPHIQSFLAPEDNDFIQALPLRRFFSIVSFAKAPGQVVCIAAGKVHSCTLTGSADGTVFATNPMRKVSRLKDSQYQQIWFRHEWVPTPKLPQTLQSITAGEEETSSDGPNMQRHGVSRITEGYKVESLKIIKTGRGKIGMKDDNIHATIYDEETGVTQVAWNPNLHCGGWAAAGMGSGLVRVEDLAL